MTHFALYAPAAASDFDETSDRWEGQIQKREQNQRTSTCLLALAAFVVAAFAKEPTVFLAPRLWAEEGSSYLAAMQSLDAPHSLLLVVKGNYQLLENILVFVASRLPITWAAFITTYGSFAVAVLVAYQLIALARQFALPWFVQFALVLIWALAVPTYEVFATATNVQWVCSISIFFLCLSKGPERGGLGAMTVYAWALICGLTGVPSCMLAPGFIFRGIADKSRPHLIIAVILSACCAVQLLTIYFLGVHGRHFAAMPEYLLMPTLLRTIVEQFVSVYRVEHIAAHIRASFPSWNAWAIAVAVLAASIGTAVLVTALKGTPEKRGAVIVLAALWAIASLVNTFGSLDLPPVLISPWNGARYFMLGTMAFPVLLALCWHYSRVSAAISLAGLVLILATSIIDTRGHWYVADGPSWRSEVERCGIVRPCTVTIWPPGWTVLLLRR